MKKCPTCRREYPGTVEFCPNDGMKLRTIREKADDPLVGRALDNRWVVEAKLGEGGMGAVYKGHQRSVNRTVAIKTLRPQLVENEEFVGRFFREAQIAANISHPNCVTILDYGESSDGTLYLAMEFLEGELLTDRMKSGTLTVKQVLEIGIQVASALSAAHEQNIVHRDLKPDNIFLIDVPGGATFAKVLDFGIAKMLDSDTQVTKTGMIFGTPEYMSPEQCQGAAIDGRSDVYALGCILYELIGGRTPFKATTPMAVLLAHVNESVPQLAAPASSGSAGLEAIVMKCLEKSADARYPSAAALREALEAELGSLENPSAPAMTGPQTAPSGADISFDQTAAYETGEEPALTPSPDTSEEAVRRPDSAFVATGSVVAPETSTSGNGRLVGIAALLVVGCVALAAVAFGLLAGSGTDEAEAEPVVATAKTVEEPPVAMIAAEEEPDSGLGGEVARVESDAGAPKPIAAATEKPSPKPAPKPAPKAKAPPKKAPTSEPVAKKPDPVKTSPQLDEEPPVPAPRRPLLKDAVERLNEKAEKTVKKIGKDVKKGTDKTLDDLLDDGMMEQ